MRLELGDRIYDLTTRALVMGILNRTPDSFFTPAATQDLDALLRRAERLAADGADLLDIGGVTAGEGREVSEQEELDRVVPAVQEVAKRIDLPVSVDTWRSAVAKEAFAAGAVLGNDISGFADPEYLAVAASAGASVVATHIRLAPRVPDPRPVYDDVVVEVRDRLADLARTAEGAGVARHRIVVDAGLDLGKTAAHSLALLRSSDGIAALGYPLLLSASNKPFLGALLDAPVEERSAGTVAANALGVVRGCRVLRVHDARAAVRVRDVVAAILEAG